MQHGFQMEPLKQDADCITKMRDFNIILIIIYPSLASSSGWDHFLKLIGLLFENKPLWHKVRVVSLAAEGQSYLKPSGILQNSIENSLHLEEFLRVLDQNTYCDMPQDRDQLIESMRQTLDEETESVLQNSRYGSHEEESHSLIPVKQTDTQCPREIHHNTFGDQLSVTVHVCAVPERVPDDDAESGGSSSASDLWILVDAVPNMAQVPDPVSGLVHVHVPDPVHGHVSEHIVGQVEDDFLGPVGGQILGQAQGEDSAPEQISVHGQAPGPIQDEISVQDHTCQNISCDTKVEPEVSEYALQPRLPPEGCDSEETSRKQPLGQREDLPYLGEGMRREDSEEETFRKTVPVHSSDEEDDACCRNSSPSEWLENTSPFSQDSTSVEQHSSGSPNFGPELQNWSSPASGKEELCSEQTTPSSSKFDRIGMVTDYEAAHHSPAPHGHGENISELVSASGAWHREAEEDSYHSSTSNKGNSFPTQSFACGPEQFISSHQRQTYGQRMENSNSAYKSDHSMHQPFDKKENKASGQSAPAADFVAKGPPLTTSQRFLEDNRWPDEALLARGACNSSGSPSFGPELQNWSSPASGKEKLCSEQTTPSSSKFERRPISQPVKPEPPQDASSLRQGPLGIVTDYEAAHHNPAPHGHGENISELVSASGAWHREAEEDSYHSSTSNKGNSFPTQSFACGPEQFISSHQRQTYGQRMENSNSAYKSDHSMHQPFDKKENKASGQSAPAADFVAKGPPLTTSQRFLEDNRWPDEALLARGACNSSGSPSFGPELQNWSSPASGKEKLCSEQTTPSSSKFERRPISQPVKPEPPQDASSLRQGPLGIVTDYEAAHHNPAPHGHGENISELVSASGAWHREAEEDSYHSSTSNKGNSFPTQSFACGPEQFISSHQRQTYGQRMENSNSAYKSDHSMHQPFDKKENKASGQSAPAADFVAKGPPLTTSQRFLEGNRWPDEALLARGACNSDAAAYRPQGPLNSIDHPLLLQERGDGSPFQDELRQFAEILFEPLQDDARLLNNGPARRGLAVEQNAFGRNDRPESGRNQQDGRRQPVQHYYDSDEDQKDSGFSRGDSDSMN